MYEVEPPVEIPGVGQVKDNVICDAVTRAEFELEISPALAMRWRSELREMVEKKTWRSARAAEVLLRIERAYASELSMSEDGKAICSTSVNSPSTIDA